MDFTSTTGVLMQTSFSQVWPLQAHPLAFIMSRLSCLMFRSKKEDCVSKACPCHIHLFHCPA